VFHVPVRLGIPQGVAGLGEVVRNPIHATGVGLLLYARSQFEQDGPLRPLAGNGRGVVERMKSWFQGYF
jgi:cell division protein FtsA